MGITKNDLNKTLKQYNKLNKIQITNIENNINLTQEKIDIINDNMKIEYSLADVEIEGRTLINLLGKLGNPIYKQINEESLNNCNIEYEHEYFKFTKTSMEQNGWLLNLSQRKPINKTDNFICLADVKTVNGAGYIHILPSNGKGLKGINYSNSTELKTIYFYTNSELNEHTTEDNFYIDLSCSAVDTYYVKNIRIYKLTDSEYNQLDNMNQQEIIKKYPYVDDIKCVVNPYIECENSRIMFETNLYDGEKIIKRHDGLYIKNAEWDEFILDDNQSYSLEYVGNGIHGLIVDKLFTNYFTNLVKYNGEILQRHFDSNYKINEGFHLSTREDGSLKLYIAIPNSLSGWGENYTPTQDEIKAFFLGWTMYGIGDTNPNYIYNDGGKGWVKIWNGLGESVNHHNIKVINGTHTNTCPSAMNDQGYTPYKLIYQKDHSVIEEIKTYGQLIVSDNLNINADSGLVIEEENNGFVQNGFVYFNEAYEPFPKHRVENILKIKSNGNIEDFKIYNFSFDNIGTRVITQGICQCRWADKINNRRGLIDYTIYRPDTVTNFYYKVIKTESFSEINNKLPMEIYNTIEKFSSIKKELERTKYELSTKSNPNLLINGDFQIWQRGQKFINQPIYTYTADRWAVNNCKTTIEKTKNGLKAYQTEVGDWCTLGQTLDEQKSNYLKGKTVTLSLECIDLKSDDSNLYCVMYLNNNIYHPQNRITQYVKKGTSSLVFNVPNVDYKYITIYFYTKGVNSYFELKWVKLELGKYATQFIPKTYAEELNDCQRYYIGFDKDKYIHIAFSKMIRNMNFGTIPMPTSMRTIPTCILEDEALYIDINGSPVYINASDFIILDYDRSNSISFCINGIQFGEDQVTMLVKAPGKKFGLDSEIY